jgi:hypothetical protein
MATKQDTVIWSTTGALLLILLGIIGWLIAGKDSAILTSIKNLGEQQEKWQAETRTSDQKIIESLTKLCDRQGMIESRVGNLEIFIQMPFVQRQKLFESFRLQPGNGKDRK